MIQYLEKYFEGINTEESKLLILFLVGAFLIGFLLALIIWGSRVAKLKRAKAASEASALEAQKELQSIQGQMDERDQLIDKMEKELNRSKERKSKDQEEVLRLSRSVENLQKENKRLKEDMESYTSTIHEMQEESTEIQNSMQSQAFMKDMQSFNSPFESATMNRLNVLEKRLSELVNQVDDGRVDSGAVQVNFEKDDEVLNSEHALNLVQAKLKDQTSLELDEGKDDLKLIEGIGPFLESKLNDIGFYTFDQLASLDEETGRALAISIGFLPDRVEKDQWIKQAIKFAKIKSENPEELSKIAEYPTDMMDLQIFPNIGAQEENILKLRGYNSWDDLALADFEDLKEILLPSVDEKYISTLSQQAQMAVEGKWEKLKAFQSFLS